MPSGKNPRTLPKLEVEGISNPARSLEDAVHRADDVLVGVVTATTFASVHEGLPIATSTVQLTSSLKSSKPAPAPQVVVLQRGGPVPSASGGALAYLETDEALLLPGDRVVLLLAYWRGRAAL